MTQTQQLNMYGIKIPATTPSPAGYYRCADRGSYTQFELTSLDRHDDELPPFTYWYESGSFDDARIENEMYIIFNESAY
jgi:hypothetical protein